MVKRVFYSRHKERLNLEKIQLLGFISFLMGFSGALLSYILSSYFKLALGTDNVGGFFLLSYFIVLIALLNLHKLVGWLGKTVVFYITFLFRIVATIFLVFLNPSPLALFFLVIYVITEGLGWVNLDVILESFSIDKMSGRIRGLHLTIMNTGFILGPFLSTRILDLFGYKGIFFATFTIQFLIFSIALMGFRGINHTFHRKETAVELLKRVWHRKNVLRAYYISAILEVFYAVMIIYSPLYFLSLGFSWTDIGIAFSIMLIPFVIVQYPMGLIADTETGEKEFLILSIFIMGISTLVFFYNASANIFVWAGILFLTRVGAALIEVLRDSYFYKRIDGDDIDLIDFFRTSKPIAYMAATAVSSVILFFFSMKYVFLFLAIIIFSAFYPAIRLVDNKSEKELRIGKLKISKTN